MADTIASNRFLTFRGESKAKSFREQLKQDEDNLNVISLDDLETVRFDRFLRLGSRYQLTTTGAESLFSAVCKMSYPPLRFLLREDGVFSTDRKRQADMVALVAGFMNNLMQLRHETFESGRLICCDKREQVDGYVTDRYALIRNSLVYDTFRDLAGYLKGKPQLLVGSLYGRVMTAALVSKESSAGKLHLGVLCQNGETSGQSIRVAQLYFDENVRDWSLDLFDSQTRVIHVKPRVIVDKMYALADTLSSRKSRAVQLQEAMRLAARQQIGSFAGTTGLDDKLKKYLADRAHSLSISVEQITKVVDMLAKYDKVLTRYDVYRACLQAASSLSVHDSLALRQLSILCMLDQFDG